MELLSSNPTIPSFLSCPTAKQALTKWVPPPQTLSISKGWCLRENKGVGIRCGRSTIVMVGLGRESEEVDEEEGKELTETENCRGNGMVELLECLEREAIMGDDQGREPNDYNRRARIFHKSSKVFRALKEHTSPVAAAMD